jgi:hypothetical protein
MRLIPKNWRAFQHYGNRRPPWIKLHRELLDDREFMSLPMASKAMAPLLWLLASESEDASFDAAIDELAFRLRLASKEVEEGLKPLIDKGFFLDASTMLAPCLQLASPDKETEREKEKEKKQKVEIPDFIPLQDWNDFVEMRKHTKRSMTERAMKIMFNKLQQMKTKGFDISEVLQKSIANNWSDVYEPKDKKPSESGFARIPL